MNNNVVVSTEDIKLVANNLISEKDEIIDLYNESLKDILDTSELELANSNAEIRNIIEEIKKLFTQFDNNITDLTNLLTNKIIPDYENLTGEIKTLFNKSFASEMNNLLNIDKK